MKKILALALVLVMLVPMLIACGGDGDGTTTTPAPSITPQGGLLNYATNLPEKDWDGEIYRVIGMTHEEQQYTNFEVYSEGLTGDTMSDAVYRRNQALQQKYGFEIKADLFDSWKNEVNTKMDGYFAAGDDMYDLCLIRARYIGTYAKTGYLKNLNAVEYLDFEQPTWNKELNTQLTIGDKLYFTSSNFLLQNKSRTPMIFYNRDMARSKGYIGNDEYLEEKYVDADAWTLSVFSEMVKEESYDGTGNGVAGELEDYFGLAADDSHSFTTFCQGAGFRFSTNDNGVVTINENNITMENIVTEVGKFGFDPQQVLYSHTLSDSWYDAENSFAAERALFHNAFVGSYENLATKADFEYGALPFPKYDADQDRYYSPFNAEFGTVVCIPYTCGDVEKAGFMLEAVSEASQVTTYPVFIEDKCKVQDAYDKVSAEMLDLIFSSLSIDLVDIYDPNGLKSMMGTTLMNEKRPESYVRLYDEKYDSASEAFQEIMDEFALLDT